MCVCVCMHMHACMSDVYVQYIYICICIYSLGEINEKILRYKVIFILKDKALLRINSLIYSVDTEKP